MKRSRMSIVVRVVVAVVAVGGVVVLARTVLGCGTHEEASTIERFRADPFYDAVPPDGTLVEEKSQRGSCDPMLHGEPGVGLTLVSRRYRTAAVYSLDRLRQLVDQPAAAGGWSIETETGASHPADPSSFTTASVTYCKQVGVRVFYAIAQSPPYGVKDSEVLVEILHHPDNGPLRQACGQLGHSPAPDPDPTCPPAVYCTIRQLDPGARFGEAVGSERSTAGSGHSGVH